MFDRIQFLKLNHQLNSLGVLSLEVWWIPRVIPPSQSNTIQNLEKGLLVKLVWQNSRTKNILFKEGTNLEGIGGFLHTLKSLTASLNHWCCLPLFLGSHSRRFVDHHYLAKLVWVQNEGAASAIPVCALYQSALLVLTATKRMIDYLEHCLCMAKWFAMCLAPWFAMYVQMWHLTKTINGRGAYNIEKKNHQEMVIVLLSGKWNYDHPGSSEDPQDTKLRGFCRFNVITHFHWLYPIASPRSALFGVRGSSKFDHNFLFGWHPNKLEQV